MKGKWKVYLVFAVMLVTFCISSMAVFAEDTITVGVTGTYGQTEARNMLQMINEFRTGSEAWAWDSSNSQKVYYSGLQELTYDEELERAAMQRAAEIAIAFSHTRPNGEICFSISNKTFGENIAAGRASAAAAFVQWQENDYGYEGQGHRRNMLSSSFKSIGIGHIYYNGMHFWVQEFGVSAGTSGAAADDSEKTVAVEVLTSAITSSSVTADAASVTVVYGSTAELPNAVYRIGMEETWPGESVPVQIPYTWSADSSGCISIASGRISGNRAGTASVTTTIQGKTLTIPVTVTPQSIGSASVTLSAASFTYDGMAKTPAVSSVTLGGKVLTADTDYTVSWSDNTNAGTAVVNVAGKGNYTGTAQKTFQIAKADLSKGSISSIADQVYTGKALTPSVTVKYASAALKAGTDYRSVFAANTKVGTATVTVKGTGNYTGTLTKNFKIVEPVTPAKGKSVTDKKSGAAYKITKAGTSKTATVEYVKYTGSKTAVTIPDTVVINNVTCKVTSIAANAFKNNKKVKTVTIGKNVVSIGKNAFYGCTKLQKAAIGSKVTSIGSQAFYGCKNLKTITIKTTKLTTKKVGSKAFGGIYSKAAFKVPSSKVSAYKKLLKAKGISSKAAVKK